MYRRSKVPKGRVIVMEKSRYSCPKTEVIPEFTDIVTVSTLSDSGENGEYMGVDYGELS